MDLSHRIQNEAIPVRPSQIRARLRDDRLRALEIKAQLAADRLRALEIEAGLRKEGKHVPATQPETERARLKRPRLLRRNTIAIYARRAMETTDQSCRRCGYNLFVEVCHIRPVRSFPPETSVQEINAPENLICLCPNCHCELDAGLWSPGDGQGSAADADTIQPADLPGDNPASSRAFGWGKSHYRGVFWDRSANRWKAVIMRQGKRYYLGTFEQEDEAALAYNSAARRLCRQCARLNVVPPVALRRSLFSRDLS